MTALRWLAVLIAGCAGNPPPPGVVVSVPERDGHPCDPTSKRRVTTRVDAADVLFEEITTEYLCPELQTHTAELGRISLSNRSALCPVGELVLRSSGGSTSAPTGFEATLAPTERAELRGALSQAAGYDNAEAYLLGCGPKHTADFVFVRTGVHATHVSFLVKNHVVERDRRFSWSDPLAAEVVTTRPLCGIVGGGEHDDRDMLPPHVLFETDEDVYSRHCPGGSNPGGWGAACEHTSFLARAEEELHRARAIGKALQPVDEPPLAEGSFR